MSDLKTRRTALGWSRKELAQRANVDPRTLQLLELALSEDDESLARCVAALEAAEAPAADDIPESRE
jgi:transcriptional regulator with XRE-family HTH domain